MLVPSTRENKQYLCTKDKQRLQKWWLCVFGFLLLKVLTNLALPRQSIATAEKTMTTPILA